MLSDYGAPRAPPGRSRQHPGYRSLAVVARLATSWLPQDFQVSSQFRSKSNKKLSSRRDSARRRSLRRSRSSLLVLIESPYTVIYAVIWICIYRQYYQRLLCLMLQMMNCARIFLIFGNFLLCLRIRLIVCLLNIYNAVVAFYVVLTPFTSIQTV